MKLIGKYSKVIKLLNTRQQRIIIILKNNKIWMTGKELSEFLNVSDRTIRSDIAYINLYHDGILIESNVRNGYHLNSKLLSSSNIYSENNIPQTSFQRCFYLIYELLFKANKLNIIHVMEKLFISDSSMENDLKEIKKEIEPYPTLKLVRQKSYIYLEGNEENKRQLYVNLLIKKIKENFLNLDLLASLFPKFNLLSIKELLENTFRKYNYHAREIEFPVIMAYIGTAIERILCYKYIQIDSINTNINDSIEFSIAKEFLENVSKKLNIKIKEDEAAFLAIIFRENARVAVNSKEFLQDPDNTVSQLVDDILEDIYTQLDVDLKNDKEFREGLSAHIQLLLERKKNNIHIPNLCLDELKYKYPFFFDIAVRVAKLIKDRLNITIDENDISFIEQHLGGALERMDSKNKYRVIVIDPNNQALSSLCTKKIESIFHERIMIIDSINYFEKKKILEIKPDLILTTLPLEHNLNILTVQISIFVNSQDEVKIFQALNQLDSNRSRLKFLSEFKAMIEPRFFYFGLDLGSPEEVLNFMSDELYKAGIVDENFKEAVFKREELSPTSFIYSFAIPHPVVANSKESKISVAVLKRPIQWGEFQVKLVLLLAIQEEKQKTLRTFFDWLSDIISDPKKLSSLMGIKSYDEFVNQMVK